MIVVDASVLVAQQVNTGRTGRWARRLVRPRSQLLAPQHCLVEAANTLRKQLRRGDLTREEADAAHRSAVGTRLTLLEYSPFALRIWELRENVAPSDAWYVAIAEAFQAPLATLDLRLARAPGTRCEFLTPD